MELIGLTKAVALTTLTFTLSATPTWGQTNQNGALTIKNSQADWNVTTLTDTFNNSQQVLEATPWTEGGGAFYKFVDAVRVQQWIDPSVGGLFALGLKRRAVTGVRIVATESECSTSPRICESWLRVFIQNTTGQPQRYLVIKANIYDKQRNELTNDACFSGYEIIDIGKNLLPNAKISVQTHLRKYFEYGTAQLSKVEWRGLRKPDANKVYPEVNYQCP